MTKLNGIIIPLQREGDGSYGAPGITTTIRSVDDASWRGDAELVFALERGLTIGYRGFYDCFF